jgi:hypothetical protein
MANAASSDALMQELLRWAKDNKPEGNKGWKAFFMSPGFIIAMLCVVLLIVLLIVWWRWSKPAAPAAKSPDVESGGGGGTKKTAPEPRTRTVRYVTSDGRAVPAEKVRPR